jgi:hypothetical protein
MVDKTSEIKLTSIFFNFSFHKKEDPSYFINQKNNNNTKAKKKEKSSIRQGNC